jgi:cell fate regulator YaaT (PSP1 superfamily)
MAKEQDLSLTPGTISGACGRLKCCLKFEYEGYLELEKGMPRKGEWCDTPQGRGRITDRNLLIRRVTVKLESGTTANFPADEISVVRPPKKNNNGNPKKQ